VAVTELFARIEDRKVVAHLGRGKCGVTWDEA
jgi:hypothetical protein